ncbi:MAG: rhodanese-like domain-containing protein [Proteobacteria bacterium]|nr:rhodanese-like domain-containing protein [Pseudomonadota bacterium]
MNSFVIWTPFLALIGFLLYRKVRFNQTRKAIPDLLARGARIIDVRTEEEFRVAANPSSLNIPLDRLASTEIPFSKDIPVILCCASGMRSGMAASLMRAKGFHTVLNAGPWTNTL